MRHGNELRLLSRGSREPILRKSFFTSSPRSYQNSTAISGPEAALEEGLSAIQAIRKDEIPRLHARDPHELMRCLEARNLAETGELILTAALHRKESRGWHFRKDYPYTDNKNWLKWVTLTRQEEQIRIDEIPVPTPKKSPPAEIMVPPGVRRR